MKKYLWNTDIREHALIALLITVTFFIFGPVELYYTNVDEFFFGITDIAVWLFFFCIAATAALLILQSIVPKRIANIVSAVLFAVGIGLYLQGNYINANYGVLNGAKIEWDNYRIYGICNTGIWVGMIVVSIVLSVKLKKAIVQKIHGYLSGIIIGIEIITLAVLGITAPKPMDVIVTDNEQFTVGDENNVIILLIDTFDAAVFDEMLYGEEGEKIRSQFDDFTYYDNMAGGYPYTLYSIPLILSGEWYDRTTTTREFVKNDSYVKSGLYPDLAQQGYSIGLYSHNLCLGSSIARYTRNLHSGKEKVSSANGAALAFLRLTSFRYFPHELKKYTSSENTSFDIFHSEEAYKLGDDIGFYEKLQNEGITVKEGKSFIFYHLKGIHAPYFMDQNVKAVENATEESQAWGELKIVESYLDQLKEKGVYGNSTIIVTADHGYKGLGQNPIFLVKEAEAHHEFTVNSAPVSFADLQGSFSYWAIGDSKGQTTIYDFEEGEERVRYFRWYALANQSNFEVPFVEYAILGDARDLSYIQKTGNLYGKEGVYRQENIKLASELQIIFSEGENYEDVINVGYRNFGGYIYSYGEYTDFKIDMSEYMGGDLRIDVAIAGVVEAPQRLQLYINDNYVDELVAKESGDILTYIIPESYLCDDFMEMKIKYPDMTQNAETQVEGHTDEGMAVVYDYINLNQLEELKRGNEYTFGIEGNADEIIGDGMGLAEDGLRWSCGKESNFYWTVREKKNEDVMLDIRLNTRIDGNQKLVFYMNDNLIQEITGDELELQVNIPSEFLLEGANHLKIVYPNAISPRELNGSDDDRELSVAFEKITIQ